MSTRVVKSRVFQRPRGFNSGGFMETISPTVTASSFQFNAYIEMQEEYREYDDGPNVMTPKRTEFGKSIRKRYESGDIKLSRHKMTEMEARTDGISNTLTTVQKDNIVMTTKNTEISRQEEGCRETRHSGDVQTGSSSKDRSSVQTDGQTL